MSNLPNEGIWILFGPWEQIFYLELDGQRKKRVMIKVIGG